MTDKRNVMVGKPKIGGSIFRSPLGIALPTSNSTVLNAGFTGQGYCSDAGVQFSKNTSFNGFTAWGGDEVANAEASVTRAWEFLLIEAMNENVLKTVYGDGSVTTTAATPTTGATYTVIDTGERLPLSQWVFDLAFEEAMRRIVVPMAKITTEDFTITYSDSELVAYPVKLTPYRDKNGAFGYEYSENGIRVIA